MPNAFGTKTRKIIPLKTKAKDVLGINGPGLLNDLENAFFNEKQDTKGFDRYARRILKACAGIKGVATERRRRAYVRACIDRLIPAQTYYPAQDDDWADEDPVGAFAEMVGLTRAQALEEGMQVAMALSWRGEDVSRRVLNLLTKAVRKRDPLKYLQRVKDNEEASK